MRWAAQLLAVPAYAAIEFAELREYNAPWIGDVNWSIDDAVGTCVLTGPVAASLTAVLVVTDRQRAILYDSTVRGWVVPIQHAARAWAVASLGLFIAVLVVATVSVQANPSHPPVAWWTPLAGFLVLGVYASVGVLVGVIVPRLVAAILVGPVLFMLGAFGPGVASMVLRRGGVSGTLAGLTWSFAQFAAVILACSAVMICCLVAVKLIVSVNRSGQQICVASLSSIVLIASLGFAVREGTYPFVLSREKSNVCRGEVPTVCLSPSSATGLGSLSNDMQRLARPLQEQLTTKEVTYRQLLPRGDVHKNDGVVRVLPTRENPGESVYLAAVNLASPSRCSAWLDVERSPSQKESEFQQLLVLSLMKIEGEGVRGFDASSDVWLRSDIDIISRWAVQAFVILRDCRFSDITLPWAD